MFNTYKTIKNKHNRVHILPENDNSCKNNSCLENDKYCRIYQSYIKLNGAKKHKTKHVCRIDNKWKF